MGLWGGKVAILFRSDAPRNFFPIFNSRSDRGSIDSYSQWSKQSNSGKKKLGKNFAIFFIRVSGRNSHRKYRGSMYSYSQRCQQSISGKKIDMLKNSEFGAFAIDFFNSTKSNQVSVCVRNSVSVIHLILLLQLLWNFFLSAMKIKWGREEKRHKQFGHLHFCFHFTLLVSLLCCYCCCCCSRPSLNIRTHVHQW